MCGAENVVVYLQCSENGSGSCPAPVRVPGSKGSKITPGDAAASPRRADAASAPRRWAGTKGKLSSPWPGPLGAVVFPGKGHTSLSFWIRVLFCSWGSCAGYRLTESQTTATRDKLHLESWKVVGRPRLVGLEGGLFFQPSLAVESGPQTSSRWRP